jgi:hypothetical protein
LRASVRAAPYPVRMGVVDATSSLAPPRVLRESSPISPRWLTLPCVSVGMGTLLHDKVGRRALSLVLNDVTREVWHILAARSSSSPTLSWFLRDLLCRPSVALAGQFSRVAALRPAAEPFKNLVLSAQRRVNSAAWIQRTPLLRNADAGRLAVSLAESSVVRNVMRPLTIPGKLWITWFVITRWKGTASE